MNRINKPSALRLAALAAVLALTACGGAASPPPPLAGAAIGGDFALTGSKGETVRWDDFAGKYRVVYFGYAFCPDICPTDMQRVAQGMKTLKASHPDKAAKVAVIFITIDPERDTPQVVGEFAAAFSPDIIGLTGSPEQIAAAAKAFKVFYAKGEAVAGGGYLVDHSNIVYLFGPEGEPLATLPTDQGADAVAAELGKWVS
ncbi:MAG: SCO family protein [Erythrobacter sp.]